MIGLLAVVSAFFSILVGGVVFLTGIIPFIIIYALLGGPIQNSIANGRRSNPKFKPLTRNEIPFSEVTRVRVEKKKVRFETKKRKIEFNITKDQRVTVLQILQQRFDNKVLWVWEPKKKV